MKNPTHIPVVGAEPGVTARSDMDTLLYPLPPKSGYDIGNDIAVVRCVRKEVHLVVGRELVRFSAFFPDDMTQGQAVEAFTHLVLDTLRAGDVGMMLR